MATISLCMIVKNEEKVLRRCLDSLKGICDETIIVDTGSTDATKSIAAEYTDKVYDFKWIDDFSAARNFAMDKATCDYIYMADADEVIDSENKEKFLLLKKALVDDIEIVQMRYANQLSSKSVYNFDNELRAKLYKRVRKFTFVDPVHEVVRTDPVVYDSDIEIIHMPEEAHAGRDIKIFEKTIRNEGKLSLRLITMYAKELLIAGSDEELKAAAAYFKDLYLSADSLSEDDLKTVCIVLSKIAFVKKDISALMSYALKDVATEGSSEICEILGEHYESIGEYEEARMWFYNAHFETAPHLCMVYKNELALEGLMRTSEKLKDDESVAFYKNELNKLK